MGAADVETKFVSVERVAEYMRLDSEIDAGSNETNQRWKGEIEFQAASWHIKAFNKSSKNMKEAHKHLETN